MANLIKSTRGLDIAISGAADKVLHSFVLSDVVAIVPDHYHAITPKVLVKEGDVVKAGTPVFSLPTAIPLPTGALPIALPTSLPPLSLPTGFSIPGLTPPAPAPNSK